MIAGRARQRQHERRAHRRVGVGLRVRQRLEGEGEQAIADEDRRGLAERDMRSGAAAAHGVVVHRRQVVMDERIAMDHLDGHGRPRRRHACGGAAEQLRALQHEERAQPLAAFEARVAHGAHETGVRQSGGVGNQRGEGFFHGAGGGFERRPEGGQAGVPASSRGLSPTAPSSATSMRATRRSAMRSLASQWRFSAAPRA